MTGPPAAPPDPATPAQPPQRRRLYSPITGVFAGLAAYLAASAVAPRLGQEPLPVFAFLFCAILGLLGAMAFWRLGQRTVAMVSGGVMLALGAALATGGLVAVGTVAALLAWVVWRRVARRRVAGGAAGRPGGRATASTSPRSGASGP